MQPLSDLLRERRTATPPYGGSLCPLSCASSAGLTSAELDGACKASRWSMNRVHDSSDHTSMPQCTSALLDEAEPHLMHKLQLLRPEVSQGIKAFRPLTQSAGAQLGQQQQLTVMQRLSCLRLRSSQLATGFNMPYIFPRRMPACQLTSWRAMLHDN